MRGSGALTLFLDGHCTELYIQTTQRCHKDQKCLASSYNIVLIQRHCSQLRGCGGLLLDVVLDVMQHQLGRSACCQRLLALEVDVAGAGR